MRRCLAGLVAGLVVWAPVVAATPARADDIPLDEAVALSWDEESWGAESTRSFFGVPVAVPGDSATTTLHVRNDGPTSGVLVATVTGVDLSGADADDVHHNPDHVDPDGAGSDYAGAGDQGDFYSDLTLGWRAEGTPEGSGDASLRDLAEAGETTILTTTVPAGGEVPLSLTWAFPAGATSGNAANVERRAGGFALDLTIRGAMPGSASGYAFVDAGCDGSAAGEVAAAGTRVAITTAEGDRVATAAAGPDGRWSVAGLLPGEYLVAVSDPDAESFAPPGADSVVDRDGAAAFTVTDGEDHRVDAGLCFPPGTAGPLALTGGPALAVIVASLILLAAGLAAAAVRARTGRDTGTDQPEENTDGK